MTDGECKQGIFNNANGKYFRKYGIILKMCVICDGCELLWLYFLSIVHPVTDAHYLLIESEVHRHRPLVCSAT